MGLIPREIYLYILYIPKIEVWAQIDCASKETLKKRRGNGLLVS